MCDRVIFAIKGCSTELRHALLSVVDGSREKGKSRAGYKFSEPSALFPTVEYCIEAMDFDVAGDRSDVKVEIAPPTNFFGTNYILHNNAYEAIECAILNMKAGLKRRGFPDKVCNQLKTSACELMSLEMTYLFVRDTPEEAQQLLKDLSFRAHAIHGEKARSVISCDFETVYVNELPQGMLRIYIKSLQAKNCICLLTDGAVRKELEDLAKRTVRIEFIVNGRTIKKGIPSPEEGKEFNRNPKTWEVVNKGVNPAEAVFGFVRSNLMLDREMKATGTNVILLDILRPYQEVLQAYFNGDDPREHRNFQFLEGDKRSKRFSACKLEVYREAQYDLTIPWAKAKVLAVDGLAEDISFPRRYQIPKHLRSYTFAPEGVAAAKEKLAEIGDGAKYEEPTVDPFYREPSTIRRPPKKPLYVPRSELPGFGVSSKSKQKPTRRGF